jgi:hypothetical protein
LNDHTLALWLLAGVMAFWLIGMGVVLRQARLPEATSGTVVVVFPPNYTTQRALSAIIRADGLLVRDSWFDSVWVVHGTRPDFVGALMREGAWGAYRATSFSPVVVKGCFL